MNPVTWERTCFDRVAADGADGRGLALADVVVPDAAAATTCIKTSFISPEHYICATGVRDFIIT